MTSFMCDCGRPKLTAASPRCRSCSAKLRGPRLPKFTEPQLPVLFDPTTLARASKAALEEPPPVTPKSIVATLVIPGTPMSKQRPRFVRKSGSVFTPRETRDRERLIGQYMWAMGWRKPPDGEMAFGVRAVFYVPDQQRKDTDNMLKLVLDGLNKVVWQDDSQVFEVMGWKREDREQPRTEITVYNLGFSATNHIACNHCGKRFRTYPTWTDRKYCSAKCRNLAALTGLDTRCANCGEPVYRPANVVKQNRKGEYFCSPACLSVVRTVVLTCAQCGTAFRKPQSLIRGPQTLNRYCSQDCQRVFAAAKRKANGHRYGPCEICGGSVSRKEYRRCSACRDFRGRRSAPSSVVPGCKQVRIELEPVAVVA